MRSDLSTAVAGRAHSEVIDTLGIRHMGVGVNYPMWSRAGENRSICTRVHRAAAGCTTREMPSSTLTTVEFWRSQVS